MRKLFTEPEKSAKALQVFAEYTNCLDKQYLRHTNPKKFRQLNQIIQYFCEKLRLNDIVIAYLLPKEELLKEIAAQPSQNELNFQFKYYKKISIKVYKLMKLGNGHYHINTEHDY